MTGSEKSPTGSDILQVSPVIGKPDDQQDSFPLELQFNILMRFIVDQTQTPNLKVKVAILRYIEALARQMDPADFVNSSETRLAVSRIITWTTEPKSADVRKVPHCIMGILLDRARRIQNLTTHWDKNKDSGPAGGGAPRWRHREPVKSAGPVCVLQAAQVVLIALFELNTPEFTMLLGALPKTFQDGTTKLLHSHLRSASAGIAMAAPGDSAGRTPPRPPGSRSSPLTSPTNHGGLSPSRLWGWSADGLSKYPPLPPFPSPLPPSASLKALRRAYSPSMLEYDSENLNTEDLYGSLRGVSEAIQNFSFRSQEELVEPLRRDVKRDGTAGVAAASDPERRYCGDMTEGGRTALDNKTSLLNTPSPRSFCGPRFRDYNPYNYTDGLPEKPGPEDGAEPQRDGRRQESGENKTQNAKSFPAGSAEQLELVGELLKELSQTGEQEDRRGALLELLKVARQDSLLVWDEHFKTLLLLLLETLGDKDHSVRALALRVLKEILRNQPARFKNYAELTIMKTLEAHKDSHKEKNLKFKVLKVTFDQFVTKMLLLFLVLLLLLLQVVRAAEEAASALAGSIHPEQCIKVLCPIVQTTDYPVNLAAIKMQTRAVERVCREPLLQLLPDVVPGLLQGYDNTESSVRKASVFCLVAVYAVIGEELKPYLSQLTGSKMKLLNLYIKRAQTSTSNSSSSSDISSY
ncbi:hypothetical protein CCH79_00016907 [Gambusia affinis]|uniref:TOG domain-containing protein n=1 Tax=Gambusia affinis TaxID=33528 RepID=A0A315UQ03_GAMAF|nr:hypothetical protein CCH79_00016907 [Gambusia affinis]